MPAQRKALVAAALFTALLPIGASAQRTPSRRVATPPRTRATQATPPPQSAAPQVNHLTAEDMQLIVDGLGFPAEVRMRLSAEEVERKAFAKDIREMLSVAEEARAAGLASSPETQLQMELSRSFIIGQAYMKMRRDAGATSQEQIVSKDEIAAFLKEPGQDRQFQAFLEDYRQNGPEKGLTVTDTRRAELQQQWAGME